MCMWNLHMFEFIKITVDVSSEKRKIHIKTYSLICTNLYHSRLKECNTWYKLQVICSELSPTPPRPKERERERNFSKVSSKLCLKRLKRKARAQMSVENYRQRKSTYRKSGRESSGRLKVVIWTIWIWLIRGVDPLLHYTFIIHWWIVGKYRISAV